MSDCLLFSHNQTIDFLHKVVLEIKTINSVCQENNAQAFSH